MSSPDQIEDRFDDLVRELRSGRVAASPELRDRVRSIAADAPSPREPRRPFAAHLSWRRAALVLAPACVVAATSAALLHGLTSSDTAALDQASDQPAVSRRAATLPTGREILPPHAKVGAPQATFSAATKAPPPSTRLQDYRVSMRVRVSGIDTLSAATVRAMRVTRSLGGYVADVHYSTPSVRHGDAVLLLRIPIANVQRAVLAYSGLGTIVAQQFSVVDLQKRYEAEVVRIAKLRVQIASLEASLANGGLTDADAAGLREQLEYARLNLTRSTAERRTTLNHARLVTARLSLTTFHAKKKQQAVPVPSHFDRMLGDAGGVLGREVVWLLYALVVGAPFLLFALFAAAAGRTRRRRVERRLLAAS